MISQEQFRQQVRAWLEENCPESQRQPIRREEVIWPGRKQTFYNDDARLWFERMRDKGWTCPDFPREYGGAGLDRVELKILREEMSRLRCRAPLTDLGISMLGPALLEFGSPEQKAEHLPKLARGEIRWCQGYSEPGAGSDLASLQCRAEDKGDHFLVNGTKIWTSFGVESDWIFCLVRTRNEGPKQSGISFLLIDMETPGVEARPIELISGVSEFAQVFFEDVRVPKENLVGEVNEGWTIAKFLLKHERKMMSELGGDVLSGSEPLPDMIKRYVGSNDKGQVDNPDYRGRLAHYEMMMRAIGLTGYRVHQQAVEKKTDPNLPLIMKLLGTRAVQIKDELIADAAGIRGLGWDEPSFSDEENKAARQMLFNKALTIAGGTNEVQLNIIAKRVLNLPGGKA